MSRSKVIFAFALAAVLSLAAGVVGGMLVARVPETPRPHPQSLAPLAELNLSPDQQEKMKEIWQQVQTTAQDCYRDARKADEQWKKNVETLLTDEQKAQYSKITQDYNNQWAALKAKRNTMFRQAIEQTRKLLDASQREKYEQILKRQLGPEAAEDAGLGHDH